MPLTTSHIHGLSLTLLTVVPFLSPFLLVSRPHPLIRSPTTGRKQPQPSRPTRQLWRCWFSDFCLPHFPSNLTCHHQNTNYCCTFLNKNKNQHIHSRKFTTWKVQSDSMNVLLLEEDQLVCDSLRLVCLHSATLLRECCHSCVSLSVLPSVVCCDWSKLEMTKSSFLSASSSAPPLARAPWTPFLSSFFSWRLSRMKPGMQIMKEMVRRLRVRPRYATLTAGEEKTIKDQKQAAKMGPG